MEDKKIENQLPAFFQRSGIEYAIGHSNEFRTFIYSRPNFFSVIRDTSPFLLAKVKKAEYIQSLPAGFVSDSWFRSKENITPSKFLRESNTVIANLYSQSISMRIVNIENDFFVLDETLKQKLSIVYLYVNTGHIEEAYGIAKNYNSVGLPVVLLRAPAPKDNPMILDWNSGIYDQISKRLFENQDIQHKWSFTTFSYFPDLNDRNQNHLFHSDSNQIATYDATGALELSLPKFKAVLLTVMFFLLSTVYLLVSLIWKTR